MLTWFLLAFSAAIIHSFMQTLQKRAVTVVGYSKVTITFVITAIAAALIFVVSYFIVGLPQIDNQFWSAIFITGALNALAWPIMLKAYEVGEFSSVYSMILLTPVFLLITSFIFLGEAPSPVGILGVLLTVSGLWFITSQHKHIDIPGFAKGNWLGVSVAAIFSISVNFDKLAVQHSDRFLGSAGVLAVIALGSAIYLLTRYKKIFLHTGSGAGSVSGPLLLVGVGVLLAIGNVVHNSALLAGLASYTIAVKRMGVLLGVVWGWLFFKEKNISQKLFGAVIAVLGVVTILFS